MLKRQRQPSPPPSSSVPFISDDIPISKRPRIQPPVLDGQARGRVWDDADDDGEEDVHDSFPENQWPQAPQTLLSSEYKSANSVLHDLHALNRHRMIFSNPNFNSIDPYGLSPTCITPQTKAVMSPILPHHHQDPAPDHKSSQTHLDYPSPNDASSSTTIHNEEQKVKERYEDSNKFVSFPFNCHSVHRVPKTFAFGISFAQTGVGLGTMTAAYVRLCTIDNVSSSNSSSDYFLTHCIIISAIVHYHQHVQDFHGLPLHLYFTTSRCRFAIPVMCLLRTVLIQLLLNDKLRALWNAELSSSLSRSINKVLSREYRQDPSGKL